MKNKRQGNNRDGRVKVVSVTIVLVGMVRCGVFLPPSISLRGGKGGGGDMTEGGEGGAFAVTVIVPHPASTISGGKAIDRLLMVAV